MFKRLFAAIALLLVLGATTGCAVNRATGTLMADADLSKVKTPSYFISTIEDHIAPWRSVYLGSTVLGGPVRFALGGSGHIAGIVNPPSANKYGFWTNDAKTRPETPDEWFEGARQHEGSWWTDWQKWITALDDTKVPARDPAKGKLKPLEDAPGSFVKFRLDTQKKK